MIFNFESRNRISKPFEGTQPLTSNAIVDVMSPGENSEDIIVGTNEALSLSAYYRATNIISSIIGRSDKFTYSSDGKLETLSKTVDIINNPNPMIDDRNFWSYMVECAMHTGNAYAIKVRQGKYGRVKTLTPLDPYYVEPKFVTNDQNVIVEVVYTVRFKSENGAIDNDVAIPADEIFHLKGQGYGWLKGTSIIESAKRSLGSSILTERYAKEFYGKGSLLSGILTTDKRLDEKTAGALKDRWRQKVQGIRNAFDIAVMDSGTTYQPINVSPEDAQFIAARDFNVVEIGRFTGIPKELLDENTYEYDPEKSMTTLVQLTIKDWTSRIESAVNRQILSSGRELKIPLQDVILADERTRSSAAVMWRKAQAKSVNEIRVSEGQSPIDDPEADNPMYIAPTGKGAIDPGANLGNTEHPVPTEQDPEDEDLNDMNDSNNE